MAVLTAIVFLSAACGDDEAASTGAGAGPQLTPPPAPSPTATTPAASASPIPLALTVCIDDDTWQKPTLEEQAAHIEADRRYTPFSELGRVQFEAAFWVGAGPATARPNPLGRLILFTGLWDLGDSKATYAALDRGCPDEPNVRTHPDLVDIWLLGYEAAVAIWDGARVVISVAPKPAGFQAVQLRFPGPVSGYPSSSIVFVGASGAVVGRIDAGGWWSTAP